VWDGSWKYTPDGQECMKIWFDGEKGNPNDRVAKQRVEDLMRQRNTGVERKSRLLSSLFMAAIVIVV
jgi:hypothetical protein